MGNIAYRKVGESELDVIQSLWESLNAMHEACSPYFADRFKRYSFAERKRELLDHAHDGRMQVLVARDMKPDSDIGYCVSTFLGSTGKIDSLFVDERCRGCGIGHELMVRSLEWLNGLGAKDIVVDVVAGNESAWNFYARYGFAPHRTCLLHRGSDGCAKSEQERTRP